MKVLVINGPNLNMLGIREVGIYGKRTYEDLCGYIREQGRLMGMETEIYQSNHEGAIIDLIQSAYGKFDGVIINPAGYTHTSVAIADAVQAISVPTVEVHLSDVNSREDFRKISYVRDACIACFAGEGFDSYRLALELLAAL